MPIYLVAGIPLVIAAAATIRVRFAAHVDTPAPGEAVVGLH
jgi:hypothetical protein